MAERFNQETDRNWNTEPGMVIVPGSKYAQEMQKHEQFPSVYGQNPGNPYRYRPFPKMVYRAQLYQGRIVCGAAPPDPLQFPNPGEFQRTEEAARRFTESCQMIVRDEREYQQACENGFRETPSEAVAYLESRQRAQAQAAAERNYADQHMSEAAKAEAAKAVQEAFTERGEHLAAVPETPIKRRRGRPPKNATA